MQCIIQVVVFSSVHLEQRTHATSLAEKYHDFGVLIELCESAGDQDTLQRYMTQFTQQVKPLLFNKTFSSWNHELLVLKI